MKKLFFIVFLMSLTLFAVLFLSPGLVFAQNLQRSFVNLDGGLVPAVSCNQPVTDSKTFSDEPYRLLYSVSVGGLVNYDDVFAVHWRNQASAGQTIGDRKSVV